MKLIIPRNDLHDVSVVYEPTISYAEQCIPDHQQQAEKLESLRYKWGGYANHRERWMQRLGDWALGRNRPTLHR